MKINIHRFFLMLATILLLGPVGCGLKDYEERMDQERKKAKLFDLTESYLDDRLETPVLDEKPAWSFEVFLRVPRGCQRIAKSNYSFKKLHLFRFPFSPEKPKEGQPESPEKLGWNLFVGCPSAAIATDEEFRERVLGALKDYYAAEFTITEWHPNLSDAKVEKIKLDEEEEQILKFAGPKDFYFQLFIRRDGINRIALVFQTPKEDPSFKPMRDACLKTLDISADAMIKKANFAASNKAKK